MKYPKPNIVEVLEYLGGSAVSGSRSGWMKARCPLHEDRSPSASVNEDQCRFNCFVCDFNGDAVDLIKEAKGVGAAEAISICKEQFGEGDSRVRDEPASRGGLSVRPRVQRAGGTWVPPWSRGL